MKFKHQQKTFLSFLQLEVLIALGILVISVSCSTLGLAIYQRQSQQLRIKLHLNETVQQLAEQMDACVSLWNHESFFLSHSLTPFDHVSLDQCSRIFLLNELKANYQLKFSQHTSSLPIYVMIGKKTILMDDIEQEQVYFYCASLCSKQWISSNTFRSYGLS